jgi:hypothetical protein
MPHSQPPGNITGRCKCTIGISFFWLRDMMSRNQIGMLITRGYKMQVKIEINGYGPLVNDLAEVLKRDLQKSIETYYTVRKEFDEYLAQECAEVSIESTVRLNDGLTGAQANIEIVE